MKKQLVYFIILAFALFYASCVCVQAANTSNLVKIAVKKYKAGNYTGCLQDCQNIVGINPSDALAYYYMAMSYVQAGQKDKAIDAYGKALNLKPGSTLAEYATTGKRCLETPDQCVLKDASNTNSTDNPELDKFIASPTPDGLSDAVRKDLEQKRLNSVKSEINNDKEVDDYDLKKLNDASEQVAPTEANPTTAKQPSQEEIATALKVLNEAGVNPYSQTAAYQNPQAIELNMLSAVNNPNSNNNDNNTAFNILPLIMAQSKTGQGNYSPELMQAFIMNSMLGNMDFNLNKNNNENGNY